MDFIGEPLTDTWLQAVIACALIIIHTILNLSGVKVTAIVTNLGLCVEVGMTLVLGGMFIQFHLSCPLDQPSIML
jgi:amino acid transporter